MPGFNQTGPLGNGPMTGRGRGRCRADRPEPGADISRTAGMGRGMGFGYGFRGGVSGKRGRGFPAGQMTLPQADVEVMPTEVGRLRQQMESMQQSLNEINQRIMEMEKNV